MAEGEPVVAVDPVEALAVELRLLLRKGAVDLVDPNELAILHHIAVEQGNGLGPRVVSLQPILDLAIADVADQETRLALQVLLGHSNLRYRSMKERGTRAAKIVGVGYDAYRRVGNGRLQRDLLWLAAQIAIQQPASMVAVGVKQQRECCEFCGSGIGYRKLRSIAV